MHSLKHARCDRSARSDLLWLCESQNTAVRDGRTLDQSDALQFREGGQLHDRVVCEVGAASQIDVTYPVTQLDQLRNADVCDSRTVAEMYVVQVLP
jgi:hypothetical protein